LVFLELIEKKRDGGELSAAEIDGMIGLYTDGGIADYQMSSFLMAIMWRGLTSTETATLTQSMAESGAHFDLSNLPGPKVDKHSTGGVGDKVSLLLAPLAATCGCIVPMVSGRSLGHTGGTLDKLESIPGFRVDLGHDEFRKQLEAIGVAMGAQTKELVPADRKLYELRSLTGTIPETGLITASILSKKIAEGTESLVLDVKMGSGAFMQSLEDARQLADRLHQVAILSGLRCSILITEMDQPLGYTVGNSLEVREAIAVLSGDTERSTDLKELTLELTAEMLVLSGLSDGHTHGLRLARKAIESGKALERFGELIEAQGGNPRIVDNIGLLPQSPHTTVVTAPDEGWIMCLDARLIGDAAVALGAGRLVRNDSLDPAAGIELHAKCGHWINRDEPWATLYHGPGADVRRATTKLSAALSISPDKLAATQLVKERRP
jgi:pyrimidine-nucleoside phosphorylase